MGLEKYVGKILRAELTELDGAFGGQVTPKGEEEVDVIVGRFNKQTNTWEYQTGIQPGLRNFVVRDFDEKSRQFYVEVIRSLDDIHPDIEGLPKKLVMLSASAEIDAEIKVLIDELSRYPAQSKTDSNRIKKYIRKAEETADDAKRLLAKMSRA